MTNPHILIADDDITTLSTTAWLLKAEGYAVTATRGGAALFEQLEQKVPDLLLLDVTVPLQGEGNGVADRPAAAQNGTHPEPDGYETLARIKADDRWRDMPVLMVAPYSAEETAAVSLRLGAADVVRKPVRVRELLARIQAQLRAQEALTRTRAALRVTEDALRRLRDDNARLEVLALTDPLTQVLNRRALTQRLSAELDRARRYNSVVTLLMLDIDFFKDVNDAYGHLAGDAILQETAAILTRAVRSVDIVARYGGEEFAVVLPETTEAGAVAFAERLRERIAGQAFSSGGIRVTASIGVAAFPAPLIDTAEDLFARSDAALYRAKAEGRNRVRT